MRYKTFADRRLVGVTSDIDQASCFAESYFVKNNVARVEVIDVARNVVAFDRHAKKECV